MQYKLSFIRFLLLSITLSSCGEKEVLVVNEFEPQIITGYHLRDQNGYPYGTVGVPNTQLTVDPQQLEKGMVTLYPNPATSWAQMVAKGKPGSTARFWLVPASMEGEQPENNLLGVTVSRSTATPLAEYTFSIAPGSNHFSIDVSILPTGYYRAFLQTDDFLLWDNFVIQH